jgi:localization factor PodJL
MTSGAAWNTRPFRPETLQAAREAARRSGLSLAEWLNSAILDTAADAGVCAFRPTLGADDLGPEHDRVTAIGERLDALTDRIDRLMKRGNEPDVSRSAGTWSRPAPEIRASLHTMEARLGAIVREFVPQRRTATQRLADVIADLNSRLDRLAAIAPAFGAVPAHHAAPDPAPGPPDEEPAEPRDRAAGLSHAVAEISARQRELDAEIGDAQDFSRFEQQLRHLTEQIEALRRPADTAEPAAARSVDGSAFERIERKMLELAQKLDASDARLDSLGTIERSIADLMFQLKETRAAAAEEAERAARAVATEMLADSGATALEIDALKQELADFRGGQVEIDRRTEDALEAVHDTLERLVDRLATMETGVRTGTRPSAEPQPVRMSPASRTGSGSAPPPVSPLLPRPAAEHRGDDDLRADHPLEPGSGAPRGRTASSPDKRTAASQAVLANPAPPEPAAAKTNFIAAARRAAQAAAAEDTDPPDPKGARSQAAGEFAAAVANRRRPLMIAAGVLLFGAGGMHAALNGDFLPPLGLKDFARTEAPRAASEDSVSAVLPPKPVAGAASGRSRAALAPDPIVPESGPTAARRPSSAAGDEFLLSPVPDGGMTPGPDSQPRESVPSLPAASPALRAGEVTGSLPSPHADATTPPSQPVAREPAPGAAENLPTAIGSPALRSAAAAGNPAAEYEIGLRFTDGRGVPQSFEQAARWLARAADHGLAPAQYRLGGLYEKGQGVKKDLMEARRLYLAAAQQGNAKAMHNLAVLYAVGLEGSPDYQTASEWFRKAADHGVADSQYNLGILYARGVGVAQNLAESYKWFALAAQQGDKDAAAKRDDVAARLDAPSLVATRLAVQTWTADPEPDKATKVEAPGGDWDRAHPIAPPAGSKPGRRSGTSGAV